MRYVFLNPRSVIQAGVGLCALAGILALGLPAGAQNQTDDQPRWLVNDQSVLDAVEDEFVLDPVVDFNAVTVEVEDGIATLSGEVDSLAAKDRAERLAETVRGVLAVVNNLTVSAANFTEAEIKDNVHAALVTDAVADANAINLEVDGNEVTLTGTVETWQDKEYAGELVRNVRGVGEVINDLSIDMATDRSDEEIEQSVQEALSNNMLIRDALIDVEVEDGAVILSGVVGSAAEEREAIHAAWVLGVEDVDAATLEVQTEVAQDIETGKYAERTDDEVRQAVEDALLYEPRVNSFNVETTVNNGVATLRGEVNNLEAKRVAANVARNTVGVDRVRNRLRVQSGVDIEPVQLEQNVVNALERNPYVDRFDITVSVVDDTAYLYGEVDSTFEKSEAENVVSRIVGVEEVRNNLVVDTLDAYSYDPYLDDWSVYDYDWYDYDREWTYESDAEIADDIEGQYFWSPFVDGGDIVVTVDDGVATLTGEVDSWREREAATENAYEGGATWVDNDLVIR